MLCDQPQQLRATASSESTADSACVDVNNHENPSIKLTFRGALLHPHTRPLPHGPCQWTRTVAASPFDVKYISIVRCNYDRGQVTGLAHVLHPPSPPLRTTTLRYVCAFEDGLPHGPAVVLARDGVTELRSDTFDKGTGAWFNTKLSSFYDDGPAMHGPYSLVNGEKEGVWNQYTGDGILQRVTLFSGGKRNGVQTTYHPGGNIECTQAWREGCLDGLMWIYRVDGTLEQSQMFVKGLLHGPSILYHTDGATVVRSLQFVHNLQDGTCQWFRNDGSRLSSAEYSYGKLHGLQTWFKSDGISIDYVEKYWNGARARTDVDHVTGSGGSPGGSSASGVKWTELEREQIKLRCKAEVDATPPSRLQFKHSPKIPRMSQFNAPPNW